MPILAPESMAAPLEITFLGTGTSVGIPVIGCDCPVCRYPDPRNRRGRSSITVRTPSHHLLVDSGPDLRAQALRENLRQIDAVLYTHGHLDHVVGFDELRAFCWHRRDPLPLHATRGCLDTLIQMFGWAFAEHNTAAGYVRPDPRRIDGPFSYGDLTIEALPVDHASVETIGFLFSHPGAPETAYLPDLKRMPPATAARLSNIPVLILDALRPKPHPTHLSIDEAVDLAQSLHAGTTWLTHLSHENDHASLAASLPPNIQPAHDGMRLNPQPGSVPTF